MLASLLYLRCSERLESESLGTEERERLSDLREFAQKYIGWEIPEELGVESHVKALERRAQVRCRYLGERLGSDSRASADAEIACEHPQHDRTTQARCHRCRDWEDPEGRDGRPGAVLHTLSPPQGSNEEGLRFSKWMLGVTTSPRPRPTLSLCLDTLLRSGWDDCLIFADGPVTVARRHEHLPVVERQEPIGAWPSYYLALTELVLRQPTADAYLLVQDDAAFYDRENLKVHLESISWPRFTTGVISLYCSGAYTQPEPGWHTLDEPWVWGAVAFVFPRDCARRFLGDEKVLAHRWKGPDDGLRNIDTVVNSWAQRNDLQVVFPTPSLVQHIGDVSTLWPAGRAWLERRADRFAGEFPESGS